MFRIERLLAVALTLAAAVALAAVLKSEPFIAQSDTRPEELAAPASVTASWSDLANPVLDPSGAMKAPLRAGYGTHIVMFEEAPLAAYRGDVGGIPAPRRDVKAKNGRLRLDVTGPAARAYVSHLRKRQAALNARIGALLGRSVPVKAAMQHAVNAIVVDVSAEEAETIRAMPGVQAVEAQTEFETMSDRGAQLIGAVPVWEGTNPGSSGARYRGEGMVVAVLDTGINFGSPSFAAASPVDGYVHTNPLGAASYLGTCANGGTDIGRCNAKLIGGFDFVCGAPGNACGRSNAREEPGFGDTNGHGSHVASIAAGNLRDAQFMGATVRISGVAPRANIVAYDVCYTVLSTGRGLCPVASIVAALDSAIAAGIVDTINLSANIDTSFGLGSSVLSQAFLSTIDADIYVSAPAFQNNGGGSTSDPMLPWLATVAAVSHGRGAFTFPLTITPSMTVPAGAIPPELRQIGLIEGVLGVRHTSPIPPSTQLRISPTYGRSFAAADGCTGYPANTFAGAIAVLGEGGCAVDQKVANAIAGGAVAVVVATNSFFDYHESRPASEGPAAPGATVPVFAMIGSTGDALRDFASEFTNLRAGIGYPAVPVSGATDVLFIHSTTHLPVMENFRRGYLKPDFAAPGVNILAADAGASLTGHEQLVGLKSGTSMAAANHAGAVALLRQARPTWSVAEAKSAFALTAHDSIVSFLSVSQEANYFGSGRIRVDKAINAGLVMHETPANYRATFPEIGNNTTTLNQPYLFDRFCRRVCRFERTFRNPTARDSSWQLQLSGAGIAVGSMPARITVPAGGSVTVDIVLRAVTGTGSYLAGHLTLLPDDQSQTPLRLPIFLLSRKMRGDDYDGDGYSDIHWRNGATGRNDLWLMNGSDLNAIRTVYNEPNLSWQVVGSGDFNGDIAADILWRNIQTGQVYVQHQFAGTTLATSNYAPTVADPSWQIVAISDLDGDGKSDLIWRNAGSGRNDVWLMDGAWPKAISTLYLEPDPAWKIKGARGGTIFWRNENTGANYVQFTDGTTIYTNSTFTVSVPDQAWQIVAIDDFDDNGSADICWRNDRTGSVVVWRMTGSQLISIVDTYDQPDLNWRIVNSGDYNNDGQADLLWRNAATGENAMLLMFLGRPVGPLQMLPRVADLDWRITGLRGSN